MWNLTVALRASVTNLVSAQALEHKCITFRNQKNIIRVKDNVGRLIKLASIRANSSSESVVRVSTNRRIHTMISSRKTHINQLKTHGCWEQSRNSDNKWEQKYLFIFILTGNEEVHW